MTSHPARSRGRRRLWLIIGITAFLLVDIALVVWAVSTTRATDPAAAGPIPTFTNAPSNRPTPTVTPTPAPAPAPTAVAAPRILAVVNATEAYRATRGVCTGGDAVVEKSTDAGATWATLPTTRYNFHTIMSLTDASDTHVAAVAGANANCAIGAYASFTGGQFWEQYPQNLPGSRYIDPADPATIHTDAGAQPSPCPAALQLAESGDTTAVLCEGTVALRAGQAAWTNVPVPGVLALAASDSGYTLAVSSVPDCAGVAIQSLPLDGTQPAAVGCAPVTDPAGVTIARSGAELWLWSGTSVLISHDAGATW